MIGCGRFLDMPKKTTSLGSVNLADVWSRLHGSKLKPKIAALIEGSVDADRLERLGARPDTENSFLWSVTEAQDSNRLSLWTAFVNLAPARMLDNGDIIFVYVDNESAATPMVVWDHERDTPAWVAGDKLARLDAIEIDSSPMSPLSAEAEDAMRFASRSSYIVEILSRGEFDLDRYLAYDHQPLEKNDDFFKNIQTFPPTALYAMWHFYFSKQDTALKQVLGFAKKSEAQLIRDCATLLHSVLSGETKVGTIPDISKIREATAAIIKNPATRKNAQAKELRARVDAHLAGQEGSIALVKLKADDKSDQVKQTPTGPGQILELNSGQALSLVKTTRPPVTDLVLYARVASGQKRATSAVRIQDPGMPPTTQHGPEFFGFGADRVVLWRKTDPKGSTFPFDGQVSVFDISDGRILANTSFSLDVAGVDSYEGKIIVTATDGTRYELQSSKGGSADEKKGKEALLELPGKSAPEPKNAVAPSQKVELDGDTLILSEKGLKAMRGKTVLWEEPMKEAYEMVALPGRRQVAVYCVDSDHRPQVDVLYIRKVKGPVEPGEGCCSWAAIPCDGAVVEMRAQGDNLYIGVGSKWIKIDAELLSEPPKWLISRKWL